MIIKILFNWILFGLLTGLITSGIESLFLVDHHIVIPYDYPIVLLVFNIIFWIILFIAFGIASRTIIKILHNKNQTVIVFVLMIFALAYGFFSKTGIFNYFPAILTPCPDKNLSFIWVTCAIALAWFLRKRKNGPISFPLSYTPDIAVIVALFLFCSNTHSFLTYIAGVAAIFAVYFLMFIFEKWLIRKSIVTYITLFIMAGGFPIVCFLINSTNNLSHNTHAHFISTRPERPSVILIVLDTLRADRLSLYGGPVPVPHLEEFARDGTLFEHCIANSSWTPPSHASLFTGLFPSEHGCVSDSALGKFPPILAESLTTLAEIFQNQRYQTVGIVANSGYLGPGTNFNQGFQIYDCRKGIGSIFTDYPARPPVHLFLGGLSIMPKYVIPYVVAEDVTTKVKQTLEKFVMEPFFLFINYMDPHSPYYPPLPYAFTFANEPIAIWKRIALTQTMGRDSPYNSLWLSQYDGEIAYLDTQLGNLFSYLKKVGLYNKTLIIITSDHGEMFGEHGLADHRCELYQEVVHVALIIKLPGHRHAGHREQRVLTLRDVFFTITEACNISITREVSTENDFDFPAVAELYDEKFGLQQAFYYHDYKYITYEKNKTPQLFNLKEDPNEQVNIAEEYPEIVKTFEMKIQAWQKMRMLNIAKKIEGTHRSKASDDVIKRLQSLGYIK